MRAVLGHRSGRFTRFQPWLRPSLMSLLGFTLAMPFLLTKKTFYDHTNKIKRVPDSKLPREARRGGDADVYVRPKMPKW